MFEKFRSENVDSFRQRYEGTYGFYRDASRNRLLVKLTEVGANRCVFMDKRGIPYHMNVDASDDIGFEFLPPKASYYNTNKGAMYCQRVAQRQFQRGLSGKNLEILALTPKILEKSKVDFATLSAIFEEELSFEEALKNFKDKGSSFAISRQFALDGGGNVLLFKEYVGTYTVDKNKFTIKLDTPDLWRTEISDALTAIGCTSEIS